MTSAENMAPTLLSVPRPLAVLAQYSTKGIDTGRGEGGGEPVSIVRDE